MVHAMRTTWSASTSGDRAEDQGGLDQAMGGVLFIDEAYYLYRQEAKDYGRRRSRSCSR